MKNPYYGLSILLILFLSIPPTGSASAETYSEEQEKEKWKLVNSDKSDVPSWTIYSRSIPNTSFLEYKIEGKVKSSASACTSSFKQNILDLASGAKQEKKLTTYDLLDQSTHSLTTYVIHNEPFPLKDTEMNVNYSFYSDSDGTSGVNWIESWDKHPVDPSKKLKRVETFRGSWNFAPTTNISCHAINTVSFDPKKMPMWLVEPMVVNFLIKGLDDIRSSSTTDKVVN